MLNKVLIVGSAPDAVRAAQWDTSCFTHTIVINNAWKACPSWSCLIYPEDFPVDRRPSDDDSRGKRIVTAEEFVPVQNEFGGFVYAGGTMAFTAAYWALHALRPRIISAFGCDMHYPKGQTHFYGAGTADPLRADITLQSLEAKSARLMILAAMQGCAMVNLSFGPSRLIFPRLRRERPDLKLMLSDLYPNHEAAKSINQKNDALVAYLTDPLDATQVRKGLVGLRTMVSSMHHMKPELARKILKNAKEANQPILIFEISDNSAPIFLWWLAMPFAFIMTFIFTPLVRPMSWQQLVFTYLIPILPLFIAWDGAVSNARTYSLEDMEDLIQGLSDKCI